MKIKTLILGFILTLGNLTFAQSNDREVLFTIDDQPYFTDDFTRVYNKNIDLVKDESQKDLNQYIDLYVGYKLKINKANKLGLQKESKYINELKTYRSQLAKNYTSDKKVTKALVEEGYARFLKEIRASHILILVDENAEPADTLKAYQEALDIRKKYTNGEKFEDLALNFSQDPSAKENKGDLGYFSAFRMVYPFESAAYKTKVNEVSMPVRTKFGYHLIKVTDSRTNRGEITAAHIMILKPSTNQENKEELEKAKVKIEDLYSKLKKGENFESLAKQFSDDKNSAAKGGELPKFASGQLSSEIFEDIAFGLTTPNSFSEPFESKFGWHIVKLIEKHPVKKFEEIEKELESKILRDDRSRLITNSLTEKLRNKYPIKRNENLYSKVTASVNDKFYESKWEQPSNIDEFDQALFSIENKKVSAKELLSTINLKQKSNLKIKPVNRLVDYICQGFVDEQLTAYYNDNLEKEFPEFANIIEEYRDGLLLFDLMEKEIWEKAKKDTIGLENFYLKNQDKYKWQKRAEVIIASSTNQDLIKQARKFFKSEKTEDYIKEKLNTKDNINVMTKKEVYEFGSSNLPKKLDYKLGVSEVYQEEGYYFVNKVSKLLPAENKKLEDTKGKVINDYQQYLEDNWVNNLKKEFKVVINSDVFERLKTKMQKN